MRIIYFALLATSTSAMANETISYSYDVHGRLTQVTRAGTVNNDVQTTYGHDQADNRTNKTVSGAPS